MNSSLYGTEFNKLDILFSLVIYSGCDSDMFINYKTLPDNLEDYHWNSTMKGDERIMITPHERANLGGSDKDEEVFYVTISGSCWSLYDFRVEPESDDLLLLSWDYPEIGEILNDEITNYILEVFSRNATNVTITNQIKFGGVSTFIK